MCLSGGLGEAASVERRASGDEESLDSSVAGGDRDRGDGDADADAAAPLASPL